MGRHINGLVQDARQVVHRFDQVIVLGAGPGDAGGIRFLEGVVADQVGRHLPGQADDRYGVHERVGQSGHRVGGAGSGGDQNRAHPAGGAGITLGGMDRALLVAHQDVSQGVLLEQGVVDRQNRAARIAENDLNPLIHQGLDHHFRSRHRVVRHDLFPSIQQCLTDPTKNSSGAAQAQA